MTAVSIGALVIAAPAYAGPTHHVLGTGSLGLTLRATPGLAGIPLAIIPEGAELDVECFSLSDPVAGNPVWLKASTELGTGYLSDFYTDTVWEAVDDLVAQGVADCGTVLRESMPTTPAPAAYPGLYQRQMAAEWASAHVDDAERFPGNDCTWFMSEALWAGGLPQSGTWTDLSWNPFDLADKWQYPGPTKNGVLANALVEYLSDEGLATKEPIDWSDNTASGAQVGDLIGYDWDNGSNGAIDHLAMVVSVDANGYPTIAQHTPARSDRYWSWDPGNSTWIEFSRAVSVDSGLSQPQAWLIRVRY